MVVYCMFMVVVLRLRTYFFQGLHFLFYFFISAGVRHVRTSRNIPSISLPFTLPYLKVRPLNRWVEPAREIVSDNIQQYIIQVLNVTRPRIGKLFLIDRVLPLKSHPPCIYEYGIACIDIHLDKGVCCMVSCCI